jgi:hypothetical protein
MAQQTIVVLCACTPPGIPYQANLPGSTSQAGSESGAQGNPSQHGSNQQQPSLAALVHAASNAASRSKHNAAKAMLKVYSAASLQSMDASAHGGAAMGPSGGGSRHGATNHGGGGALAALLAAAAADQAAPGSTLIGQGPAVGPGSATAAASVDGTEQRDGSQAPLSPVNLARAPSSPLQVTGPTAAGLPTGKRRDCQKVLPCYQTSCSSSCSNQTCCCATFYLIE